MTSNDTDRQRRIADIEATLRLPVPDSIRRQLEGELSALISFGSGNQIGDMTMGDIAGRDVRKGVEGGVALSDDARINGVAVGVNLGTIIYGRDPNEDERRRLAWYLARLADKLRRLPLRGLEERLDHGEGVALSEVYVSLAVSSRSTALATGAPAELQRFFDDDDLQCPLRPEHDPDHALPRAAATGWARADPDKGQRREALPLAELARAQLAPADRLILWRAFLASEVLEYHRTRSERAKASTRVALVGDPGGGKSTFVRHLAWALARRGLDQESADSALFGWDAERRVLPVLLPLRTLAQRVAVQGVDGSTVFDALRAEMHACCLHQVDDMLSAALDRSTALLLLDGLDEVPLDGCPGVTASRAETLHAVRRFTELHSRAQVVVTCRTRAFDRASRELLGWPVETIAPFTLGQVRAFTAAWYRELVVTGQISAAQAERLSAALIDSIVASTKLTEMARTPLLLTMMALVLLNKGELPRDRPQLYERIHELLLGQWDQVRDGQSLAEAIGLPDWGGERFQPLLDRLSYQAHLDSTSRDGRGRLNRGQLYAALIDFFRSARATDYAGAAMRWLDYVEQRSGLLAPDGPDSYVFAHLTLQEHCAGRHIALNSEDPVALVMQHRADDRWREPIFLGAGLMHPAVLNSLLTDLIEREGKDKTRWYRDLILAAELGQDRDWSYLRTRPMVKVERLQRDLKEGLVTLLADASQPLPTAERVRAGFLLGDLGDPRFPVTLDDWRRELARAGQPGGYFCRVEPGEYIIGSADTDPDAQDNEKPQHTFTLDQPLYIARYPITNAQWQAWVEQGSGEVSDYANDADLNRLNQPVVGITWHQCNAFCAWLSEQIGATIRLPTEQEWEAAARGGDACRYPWGDDWRDDSAASAEDRESRGWRWSVPVGCYPAGAAPCGALDMAGNVWEWTASVWQSYPGAENESTDGGLCALRSGGYGDDKPIVRCAVRGWGLPDSGLRYRGFRVCISTIGGGPCQ